MILAKELRGRDVTANVVPLGRRRPSCSRRQDAGAIDALAKVPPLERLGRPEDIAGVVAFLVGPDGRWVNGQTIRANGGMV